MSDSGQAGGGSWGGWGSFGQIFEQVRQQTAELVENALHSELAEATKRDLAVFVSTVTEESARGLAETSATIATKLQTPDSPDVDSGVRGEVASLLTSFSQKLGVSQTQTQPSTSSGAPAVTSQAKYTRRELFVHQLHTSPTAFITEPPNTAEFDEWESTFDLQTKAEEISGLLRDVRELATMHANFVPRVVEDEVFWKRYFFQIHQFDQQEEERRELQRKAEEKLLAATAEDDLDWGDDESEDADPSQGQAEPEQKTEESTPAEETVVASAVPEETDKAGDESDDSWLMGSEDEEAAAAPTTETKEGDTEPWDDWE